MTSVFQLSKNIFLTASVLFGVFFYSFQANAANLQPKVLLVPMIPGNVPARSVPEYGMSYPVKSYNINALKSSVNSLQSQGYPVEVYGGTYDNAGNLTGVQTMPFYGNAQQSYDYAANAIKGSDAERIILWGGEHGSQGTITDTGYTDAFGNRSEFFGKANNLPVQEGQHVTVADNSCYSSAGCNAKDLFTPTGAIDSLITSGSGLTPADLAQFDFTRVKDLNGDGAISLSELNAATNSSLKAVSKPGEEDPILAYAKDYQPRDTGAVFVKTKYEYVGPNYTGPEKTFCHDGDFIVNSNDKKPPKGIEISDAKQCELAENKQYKNLDAVQLGKVPLVAAKLYPVTKYCQKQDSPPGDPKSIKLTSESEDAFDVCPLKPITTQTTQNNNQFTNNPNSYSNQGGPSAAAPAGNGLEALLPLIMKSLLGGGQQGQNSNTGNNSGTTQISCSQYGVSPVCGSDGKTYNNSCWLQQLGQVQVSTGVCPTTSTSPSPTPDVAKIITQLLSAGVSQSVIDSIVKSFNTFANNAKGPDVVVQ